MRANTILTYSMQFDGDEKCQKIDTISSLKNTHKLKKNISKRNYAGLWQFNEQDID